MSSSAQSAATSGQSNNSSGSDVEAGKSDEKSKPPRSTTRKTPPKRTVNVNAKDRVSIQWKDLRVNTVAGRQLLRGVSGIALPGEVVALMGASGAGKTTLLNTLLQRNMRGLVIEGSILVNGQQIGKGVTSVSAYVQQEDLFIGTLTVREHLMLQARMRLPSTMTAKERTARVDEMLREMLLEGSQSSRIGVPGVIKGISGGELKRLMFATEMLSNPSILFCDEPTTGLDSHMAMVVVKRLESLAIEHGKTIICTIHQPSSEVFEIFDKVVFLSQGRVAFLGTTFEAVTFFSSCGHLIPDHTNPADHYIDTLAIWPWNVDECKKKCNAISDAFDSSDYKARIQNRMELEARPKKLVPRESANIFNIIFTLFVRYTRDNFRNPGILRARYIMKTFSGFFLGLLYLRGGNLDQDKLYNRTGALFFYVAEFTYTTVYSIQAYMPGDFTLIVREYHDGIYPISAYYIARILSYLPLFMTDGAWMVCISYYMIGFQEMPKYFFRTILTGIIVEMNCAAVGVANSSISPSYAIAVSISGPLLTIVSITGGIFTNVGALPDWISWVQYISWFRYGFEALMINEWADRDNIDCASKENTTRQCFTEGTDWLKRYGFHESNLYPNWGMMLLMTVIIYCIGYIGLVVRVMRAR